jgi:hypothetical protein
MAGVCTVGMAHAGGGVVDLRATGRCMPAAGGISAFCGGDAARSILWHAWTRLARRMSVADGEGGVCGDRK